MSDMDLSSVEARASYGVGMQMGNQLKQAFEGVSLEAAQAGIEDAFNNGQLRLEVDEINSAIGEIQQRLEAAMQAAAGEQAAAGQAFLAENAKRAEVQVTDSGLQYEIISEGSGDMPSAESTISAHYAGTLVDGTEFDSSYKRGEPAQFPVNGVIAGWTEALQMMPVGSKWKLYIPHNLAYGEQGAGGAIGPYQTLIFEIELLDIL